MPKTLADYLKEVGENNAARFKLEEIIKEILKELEPQIIARIADTLFYQNFKSIKGEPGETPSNERLIKLIRPLIPSPKKAKDGKTPTKAELLRLIRPLIPEVKDGEMPSDERLLSLMKTLVPDMSEEKLLSLIKSLIPEIKEDAPEEVRDKLQTLEGEERLDATAIKNLPEPVRKIVESWGGYGAYDLNLKAVTLGQITANQDNYTTGLGAWFRIDSDASRTITGFEGGTDGRGFVLSNVGSNDIVLANQSSSSNAGNRIITGTGSDVTLEADEDAWIIYDWEDSRWRVLLIGPTGRLNSETPTGDVDGSNATYTVTHTPLFIVADGMLRIDGFGYTISASTVTMDIPPFQFIRSYY